MQTYTTSTQGFSKIRRDIIKRLSLASILLTVFLGGLELWKIKANGDGNLTYLIISIPVLLGAYIFTARKVISQQKEIWDSIIINIDNDYISRQQIRIPEVRIERTEVTAVEENKFGIWVKTENKARSLVIPIQLEQADYLEIKETLINWTEAGIVTPAHNRKDLVLIVTYVIAFIVLFLSFNIWLNFILGAAIIAYYAYTNKLIQNNVSVDPQFKKTYKRMFVWTILIVLLNTFGKLYMILGIKKLKEELNESPQVVLPIKYQGNYFNINRIE